MANKIIKNKNGNAGKSFNKQEDESTELKKILDHIPMGLYWKDSDLTYRGCNSQFEKLSNIERQNLPGKTDTDIHTEETASIFRKEDMEFISGERKSMYFTDKLVPMKNTSDMWARTYKIPIFDDASNIKYIMGLIQDVTKVKLDEIALQESENRLRIILDATNDYIAFLDSLGKILVANGSLLNDLKLEKNNVIGKYITELFSSNLFRKIQSYIEKAIDTSEPQQFDIKSDESPAGKYLDVSVYPVITEDGVIGAAIYAKDITKIKQTEAMLIENSEQLKTAIIEAEHASKSKSEFLSRMSHEIRTPIGAITGMAKIAYDSNDIDKIKDCLKRIDSSSKHLLGIINDVLDMSKIEADKLVLSPTVFRFEDMLMDVANVVSVQADEKKLNFEVLLANDLPAYFYADELRLRQVITNLLSNAIKFTPENGTIKLTVLNLGEIEDDIAVIEVTVRDTGIGMTPEQQAKLFQPFEQAEGGIARKYGGTGLGLAICKKIVEIMDGQIRIESAPDLGSRFTFQVKMKINKDGIQENSNIEFSDMHALIVDDSFETREHLSHILAKFGIRSQTAKDGFEAVKMVTEVNNTDDEFNIFFVDWSMPGINGIETTKKIRSIVNDNAIVIMISITEWQNIAKQAINAGVSSFIAKPLFPSNVLNVLNEIAGSSIKPKIKQGTQGIPNLAGFRILLVEDIDINREIAAALLKPTQVEIDFATNGFEAVGKYNNNKELYDLILMDIHMPDMDGYEATKLIRANGDAVSLNLPIIAMTADAFNEDIERCIAAGMNDHIAKPINEVELYKKITKYGDLSRQSKVLRESHIKRKHDETNILYINEEDAVNRLNGDKEFYIKLLNSFLQDETYLKIKENLDKGDIKSAQHAMHAIKGMAANLSLNILYNAAVKTDEMLKQNIAESDTIQDFDNAMNKTVEAIKSFLLLK